MHLHYKYPNTFSSNRKIMCDPVSLSVLAIGTGLIGTGLSAYGAYAQGQAQKKMYQYQAGVAERQEELTKRTAETNVTLTQTQAAAEAKQHARQMLALEGAQKATEGAMGIAGSVSAADIGASTFNTGKLDEMAIRYNADIRSWGIREGANIGVWDLENQRKQYLMAGKNAAMAGNIGAASSLLQGASTVAKGAYNMKYGASKGYIF